MDNQHPVSKESPAVAAMRDGWNMYSALMAGTKGMREAGRNLLPQWPAEPKAVYEKRLATSTLFPAFKRTVIALASKPLSKPITLSEDMPDQIKEWMADVDRHGRNLDTFMTDVLESALSHGMALIMTEFPAVKKTAEDRTLTVAQEKAQRVRPYAVMIKPTQLIGFRVVDGRLAQLRYEEVVEELDGDFGAKEIKQIRVVEPGKWSVWRKARSERGEELYAIHDEGINTLTEIPLAVVYGKRTGVLTSESPLREVCFLNIKHWQSQSDQDYLLHIARVPILCAIGVDETFELAVGGASAVKMPPNASLQFVEHSGAAIGAGQVSLDGLKEEMRQAGAELLVLRPAPATATEVASDNAVGLSDMQRIALGAQDAINLMLDFFGQYAKIPKPGTAKLFVDFGALTQAEASANLVLSAQSAGILSKSTALSELKRRGIVSPDLDLDEEQDLIDGEGPPVGNTDPITGLPYSKPVAPTAPGAKIDPHTGLPYTQPVPPQVPGQK